MKVRYAAVILINLLIAGSTFAQVAKKKKLDMKAFNTQMEKQMNEFDNRPIYKHLTIAIIDKTKNNELLQTIFDNLVTKMNKDMSNEYKVYKTLTGPQQAIYSIWQLQAEVNNGGFNQFYFNSSRVFAADAQENLKVVGAIKYAKLVDRANHIFVEKHNEITKYWNGTLEGFSKSYDNNPLSKLDTEFYTLEKKEDLEALQVVFIRKYKKEFVD